MSIVIERPRRWWIPALVGGAAFVGALAAVVLLALPGERLLSPGVVAPEAPAGAGVVQPPWDVSAYPAGSLGKPSRAQLDGFRKQRPAVVSLLTSIYDALFLDRGRLEELARRSFDPSAARALVGSKAGAPGAKEVRILSRRVRVGIAADGARQAAAVAIIRADVGDDKPVRHLSHLWLERADSGWKVIAFDVSQEQVNDPAKRNRRARGDK